MFPDDGIVVLESPSSTLALRNQLRLSRPGCYYFGAGGGLGFGLAAAVGVQLAQPDRPVVCVLGEGSAQYAIQALWTAVAYDVPVTFLVLRNDEYAILKWFARARGGHGRARARPARARQRRARRRLRRRGRASDGARRAARVPERRARLEPPLTGRDRGRAGDVPGLTNARRRPASLDGCHLPTIESELTMDPNTIAEPVIKRLENAWNAADGAAFAAPFAVDADFVNIRGELHSGAAAIAAGHQQIFDTIYAGSTLRYDVVKARELDGHLILAHVSATLNVPTGPLAGEHNSLASVVLVSDGGDQRVAAFHNTLVAHA